MPLPSVRTHGAKQCQVKSKRTGFPCNNPAAFGTKACRMHGAHRTHARLLGEKHPNFKHGESTIQNKLVYRAGMQNLRKIEKICLSLGLFQDTIIKGRKQKIDS